VEGTFRKIWAHLVADKGVQIFFSSRPPFAPSLAGSLARQNIPQLTLVVVLGLRPERVELGYLPLLIPTRSEGPGFQIQMTGCCPCCAPPSGRCCARGAWLSPMVFGLLRLSPLQASRYVLADAVAARPLCGWCCARRCLVLAVTRW
jgi:hypothetical protein